MKLILDEMAAEAGVRVQLHTRVVAAARDTTNRLTTVITECKSGRQAWAGQAFIDATGDGDVAAQAGCGYDYGHPETGETQPMTLRAILGTRR
jgi:flavin-dependent dehydrogenase